MAVPGANPCGPTESLDEVLNYRNISTFEDTAVLTIKLMAPFPAGELLWLEVNPQTSTLNPSPSPPHPEL